MDQVDKKILEIIQKEGRITKQELASRINLTPPATLERLRKLEKKGVIIGYKAIVDPAAMNRDMVAIVNVELSVHKRDAINKFTEEIANIPEILECYHISGTWDFMLKVAVGSMKEFEEFYLRKLTKLTGFSRSETAFIFRTLKNEEALMPIEEGIFSDKPARRRKGRKQEKQG